MGNERKMSEIFIKINLHIMDKMTEIRNLQLDKGTDLFYYRHVELNQLLTKSLEVMMEKMKKWEKVEIENE